MYPTLQKRKTSRVMIDTFSGYRHKLKINEGEFYNTKNLTTQYYPMFANRRRRSVVDHEFTQLQAILAKDALCWVDNGTLYVNGAATPVTGLQTVKETQLVSMGAYVCIFPDKVYYNTEDPTDYGSMEADWSYTGAVLYQPCDIDGNVYQVQTSSDTAPANPANGQLWLDTSDGMALRQYSAVQMTWVSIESVYTKVTFPTQGQLPPLFRAWDGVEISGLYYDELNGSKMLYGVGGEAETTADYIVLVGLVGVGGQQTGTVRIQRTLPQMDFVCEAQNRLWGCFYGNDGTQNLNEIYCCALGDFKNWRQYQGIATDSWTASVGSDGQWTGAINYRGHPLFFKETRIHTVTVSATGAHRLDETLCNGLQKGSHRSAAVVGETLYYKTRTGIAAYQGGMPQLVSDALGEELYYEAAAGVYGTRYYISMKDAANTWHLFCYDTRNRLWMHEDNLHAEGFAQVDDELYARSGNTLLALNGTDGTPETDPEWMAETGILYYELPDQKYVSRYDVRLTLQQGASMKLFIEYDSDGVWRYAGKIDATTTNTITIPVRPRRCDHLRLRMEGTGDVRLFSIAKILVKGSDV